jgi:hypothetical protein
MVVATTMNVKDVACMKPAATARVRPTARTGSTAGSPRTASSATRKTGTSTIARVLWNKEEMSRPTPVLGYHREAQGERDGEPDPQRPRNKLTFSHSVGNVAGHRRLENDPVVMREQAGNCIKGSPPQTAFERSHLALGQSEGQFRAA